MTRQMKKVAVLGSGVMGSGIAAHLANVGIPSLLLDIVPSQLTKAEQMKGLTLEDETVRNRLGNEALQRLPKQKPAPLMLKENLGFIEVGNFEDDMARLSEVDWVIEVIVENLDMKKKLFAQVDEHRKPGTLVSSNTSGISIEAMAEGRSPDFRKHFLGTHFFNPPRYLKLLEIIPTNATDAQVVKDMKQIGENILGKGIVQAKDTPNFIANRIGTYGLLATVKEMMAHGYSIGEVDAVTGPLIGRPKSATFRTLDVVGLDTFIHVANNVFEHVNGDERDHFKVPDFMKRMHEKGWNGSKAGQGFYLKKKSKAGSEILQLNPETFEYEPREKLTTAATEAAKQAKSLPETLRVLTNADDRAGAFVWSLLKKTLLYAAEKVYEIADDIVAVDNAIKWGFGWELGPFEIWDALGVKSSVERMKKEGEIVPQWIGIMLEEGYTSFYKQEDSAQYFYQHSSYQLVKDCPKKIHLQQLKKERNVIQTNRGASLIDLGDGVACVEFHSSHDAIGFDFLKMIQTSIDEAEKNFQGLVIGSESKNFSIGANIAMILMEAQDDNFFEIDQVVRLFQQTMTRIRYSSIPIVAAPFGMTLGGGTEVCLPADAMQVSAETYMGLVEVGVGLIPGGGGNKELYMRQLDRLPNGVDVDLTMVANNVFQTIATAKVSTSGAEAESLGFLRSTDRISVNGDHLLYDAKQRVLSLAEQGYCPPQRRKMPVVGEAGYAAMVMGAETMRTSGYATDHDVKIAKKLAHVIAGGKIPQGTLVDEQYLLDLEREAFLSLVGESKTQQRMQHMLLKGKPLRN